MRRMCVGTVAVAVAVAVAGCSSKTAGGDDGCGDAAACTAGEICVDGSCRQLCSSDSHCDVEGEICDATGFCNVGVRQDDPLIRGLRGNGSTACVSGTTGVECIADGLIVSGERLEGVDATWTSATGAPVALTVVPVSDIEVELILPADVVADESYTLTLTNAAGSDQVDVQLLQGEPGPDLTANEIIARLNADGTTTLSVTVLPVGSGPSAVAAGDHVHDGTDSAQVPWGNLADVPAGFADGVDDDTTYDVGSGLTDAANTFSVDFAGNGAATTVARSDHTHGCSAGFLIGGVCVLDYNNTNTTDWNTAATTCAALGGDLCSAAQYLSIRGINDGWDHPLFHSNRAVWTRYFSDNDAGVVWWLRSSDDPTNSSQWGYACCNDTPPLETRARANDVNGVHVAYVHEFEDTVFPAAVEVCNAHRAQLCTMSQYVALNDSGLFGGTVRRATDEMSDNDGDLFDGVLGANATDNPGWSQYFAYACCVSQAPADGSCPAPGTEVNNVCVTAFHETEDTNFYDAARACTAQGADICTNSEMQNLRNGGRFAGVAAWTSRGADNDSTRVGGLLGTMPNNPNPSSDQFGYACCL